MSLILYLTRHGASKAYENIDIEGANIFRQTKNTPLSHQGRIQAEQLAQKVRILRPEVLLCSPSVRSRETASIISQYNPSLFPNIIEGLCEIRRIIDGKSIYGEQNLAYKKWRGETIRTKNLDSRFHQSDQSHREFFHQATNNKYMFINDFDGQNVLVNGHSQSFAMLITSMLYGDNPDPHTLFHSFNKYFMSHCGITIMKYDNRRWSLEIFNDTSHLH